MPTVSILSSSRKRGPSKYTRAKASLPLGQSHEKLLVGPAHPREYLGFLLGVSTA